MQTQYVTPNRVDIIKLLSAVECDRIETLDTHIGRLYIGVLTDEELPPLATARTGGHFGVPNGRQYSFPLYIAAESECDLISKPRIGVDCVMPVSPQYGGGVVNIGFASPDNFGDLAFYDAADDERDD